MLQPVFVIIFVQELYQPPPRSDSVPMLDINITPQTIQETVKDMERQESKVKRFQKYLQKQASEDQE